MAANTRTQMTTAYEICEKLAEEIEVWKVFPYNERFLISSFGRIRRFAGGKWVDVATGKTTSHLYRRFFVSRNPGQRFSFVHTAVLETFRGSRPFAKAVSRHLDDDKGNNRLSNLKWGTQRENVDDRLRRYGRVARHIKIANRNTKLTKTQVYEIRESCRTHDVIAQYYGISVVHVGRIKNRKKWVWLT